jgi:hypothetical protein
MESDIDLAVDALRASHRNRSAKAKILEVSHEVRTQYRI